MDGASGQIIYAKAPDQPRQPASTIKILTGLIAMETLPNDAKVSVSRRAAGMPRSKIYLDQRKSYNADDLINAVLLASANDASVALAEKVAGSEKQFAQLMTDRAKELGASNTVCLTASGLTARGQQSTARDLAVIFSQAMKKEEFARRVGQIKTKTREGRTLRNHNKALWSITGAEGGKTGYTSAAKQTYVGQFRRNDETLLVAVMGSTTLWNDIDRLVDYGFAQKRQLTLAGGDKKVSSERIVLQPSLKKSGTTPEPASLQVLADINKIAKL
jgi:D-alanyl-D-alanine carboxypeptidase (penicillin-binding protein 5/6)